MITAILNASADWGIGKDGDLLFHIPEDMKFFRSATKGHTVVMGRKTLLSFPNGQPLKDRENIVLSKSGFSAEGVTVFESADETLEYIKNKTDEVFIIGGGEVYKAFLPYCDKVLVTREDTAPEADTFFPDLDADPEWSLTEQSEEHEYNGIKFKFCTYIRNTKKTRTKENGYG